MGRGGGGGELAKTPGIQGDGVRYLLNLEANLLSPSHPLGARNFLAPSIPLSAVTTIHRLPPPITKLWLQEVKVRRKKYVKQRQKSQEKRGVGRGEG